MANGFQGPVDQKTMIQMQSAIGAERGFARMWSAGSSPAVQAAYQQSAANKGALAANNIRMRYYKKEWEQIRETRIKPLTDQLFAAEQAYKQATASTTMPVPSTMDPAEGQALGDAVQKPPPSLQTVPGKPNKEGVQSQEVVPVDGGPAPNAAVNPGQVGAIRHQDALAIMDPTTGHPTVLASARGIELMNQASYKFWEQHKRVNMEMMDALSDYAGNPYAAQAQDGMMQNLQDRAGHGATGSLDPMAQQEWMEGRQQFETNQAKAAQDLEKGAFDVEQAQARLQAQAADAQAMSGDPKNAQYFKPKTLAKLQAGESLTKRETQEVAAVRNMLRDLEEKDIVRKSRQGVFTIPTTLVDTPENWREAARQDVAYQQDYSRILAESQNATKAAIIGLGDQGIQETFASAGAPQTVIDTALAGLWNDPTVNEWINLIAADPKVEQEANDSAFLLGLARTERQQPALTATIDRTIDSFVTDLRSSLENRGMPPLSADAEDAIRTDRYATFFTQQYGYEPPRIRDIETQRDVDAFSQRSARRQPPLVQGQPHGPYLSPEHVEDLEYQMEVEAASPGVKDPSIQAPTDSTNKAPTTGAPGQVSEAMRVYGFENPVTALVDDMRRSLAPRDRAHARPKGIGFDFQGRPLGMDGKLIETSNPYVNMPPATLQQLADTLDPASTAYELIVEALAAQNG